MKITAQETLPHFEYDKMEVTIEPFNSETRIEIEIKDMLEGVAAGYIGGQSIHGGGGGYNPPRKNSRVVMSLEDFDRISDMVCAYRHAVAAAEQTP